ncbi:hypothetical protein D1007_22743 [Hordeum vulgare]|nr:hypothetical protein D1007_22743 [Hordeum vulgare]
MPGRCLRRAERPAASLCRAHARPLPAPRCARARMWLRSLAPAPAMASLPALVVVAPDLGRAGPRQAAPAPGRDRPRLAAAEPARAPVAAARAHDCPQRPTMPVTVLLSAASRPATALRQAPPSHWWSCPAPLGRRAVVALAHAMASRVASWPRSPVLSRGRDRTHHQHAVVKALEVRLVVVVSKRCPLMNYTGVPEHQGRQRLEKFPTGNTNCASGSVLPWTESQARDKDRGILIHMSFFNLVHQVSVNNGNSSIFFFEPLACSNIQDRSQTLWQFCVCPYKFLFNT